MRFKIGEIIFDLVTDIEFQSVWLCFEFFSEDNSDITVQFIIDRKVEDNCYNGLYFYENLSNLFIDRHTTDYLIADRNWSSFSLHILEFNYNQLDRLCFIAVRSAMLLRQGVFIHAAFIDWKGQGILFTGHSGIGKSTQADLWAKEKNASIINGDVTLIKKRSERFYGYGSPWHGNSPHCENTSVPLCAITVLEQSGENCLTRLKGAEMITEVYNNIFCPHWIQDSYSLLLDILDELLNQVPVYLLKNKADDESVHLLAEELFPDEHPKQ